MATGLLYFSMFIVIRWPVISLLVIFFRAFIPLGDIGIMNLFVVVSIVNFKFLSFEVKGGKAGVLKGFESLERAKISLAS